MNGKKGTAFLLALGITGMYLPADAAYSPEQNGPESDKVIYNEYGAHQGIAEGTKNEDISSQYSEAFAEEYLNAGAYILSDQPTTDETYEEPGIYYEKTEFEFGDGLYVIIQDEASSDKFYTLIKSTQDLEVGDAYIYREGDIGGRLLDDKYTSTHMKGNYKESDYSYVSYDMGGGKLAAQKAALEEDGTPKEHQEEGFTYLYVVSEAPADYCQRMANEEAGLEDKTQAEERQYMPINNTKQEEGVDYNNWTNLTDEDSTDYNDRIIRTGSTEGESNTRLYSYSGQNVIVAKFAVGISEGTAKLAYAENDTYDAQEQYDAEEVEIAVQAGEEKKLFFHTQYSSTWGRDGYPSPELSFEAGDEEVAVCSMTEDGEYLLSGLKEGNTNITVTVNDAEGKYKGGAYLKLNVTVE